MLKSDIDKLIADPLLQIQDTYFLKSLHERVMHLAQEINQKLSDGTNKEEACKALSLALFYVKQGLS